MEKPREPIVTADRRWPVLPPMFWAWAALLFLLTFLVYLPALDLPFVNMDDPVYVLKNPLIRHLDLPGLVMMLLDQSQSSFWMPLTWLSLALDYHIGQLNPAVYHMHNLLLHCANTILVFLLGCVLLAFARRGGEADPTRDLAAAGLAAGLFGLHPIHVESVAWVTERKDVLYGFFYLLSILTFLSHRARPAFWKYGLCFLTFLMALAAKPMAITLPLVLALLDVWPLGRVKAVLRSMWLDKVPFLAVAAFMAARVMADHYGDSILGSEVPLSFRVMNAAHSAVFYLVKMFFPFELRAFYPVMLSKTFSAGYILSAILAVSLTVFAARRRKVWPAIALCWAYYLITLAPVLGFVQSGVQCAADRFTYLPLLGPFLLFSVIWVDLLQRRRSWMLASLAVILALSAFATRRQITTWNGSVTLWLNVLNIQPTNTAFPFGAVAEAHLQDGALEMAQREVEAAIRLDPSSDRLYILRGKIRLERGDVDAAIEDLKTAVSLNPPGDINPVEKIPYRDIAFAYLQKGWFKEAAQAAQEAVRIKPREPEGYRALGLACAGGKRYREAVAMYLKSLSLEPYGYNPKTLRDLRTACMTSVARHPRRRQ